MPRHFKCCLPRTCLRFLLFNVIVFNQNTWNKSQTFSSYVKTLLSLSFFFFLRNKLLHASQQNVGWLTIPIHVLPHTKIGSNYALNPCYLTVYRDDIKEIGAMLCCVRFKVTKCSYFIVHDVL